MKRKITGVCGGGVGIGTGGTDVTGSSILGFDGCGGSCGTVVEKLVVPMVRILKVGGLEVDGILFVRVLVVDGLVG